MVARGKASKKKSKSAAGRSKAARKKKLRCCKHCPDFEFCKDRGECCEYCDYYLNGRCMYGKKSGLPTVEEGCLNLPDYRGDDYGIDDYDAYESLYE